MSHDLLVQMAYLGVIWGAQFGQEGGATQSPLT